MLHPTGIEEAFAEPALSSGLSAEVSGAIERMLALHEPYPMAIMDRHYDIQLANRGAYAVLGQFVAEPAALSPPFNAYRMLFDPRLGRSFIVDWARVARGSLSRLHLDALEHPGDTALRELMDELLGYPDVPESWRQPDFSEPVEAAFTLRLRRGELEVGFITTMTVFNAPGNVTLDELRIESYFPIDAATERMCKSVCYEHATPGPDR